MVINIKNREELESSAGTPEEVLEALKANEYPAYYLETDLPNNVLIFSSEELDGLEEVADELLNGSIYSESHEPAKPGVLYQLFINTKPIRTLEDE